VKAEYWHKWDLFPHTAQKNENPSAAKLSDGHRHLNYSKKQIERRFETASVPVNLKEAGFSFWSTYDCLTSKKD
jgi:hypothetical protein